MRWLFLIHRYLGIGLGLLMVMWCLSGVVMMYVPYPDLSDALRLQALAPIDWSDCCAIDARALADTEQVSRFEVEMLAARPVLRLRTPGSRAIRLIDLRTGMVIPGISQAQAENVAFLWGQIGGHWDPPQLSARIDYDQWTVGGGFTADRPLLLFQIDDAARTQLYLSGTTGKVVQMTTARERFWNWLGAVPHWLYFTKLRHDAHLWSQVIVYASLAGCFLAFTGIYIGVRQFLLRPRGRGSGYRGVKLWHHVPGLIFGLFTLTWVASGFFSMNPWGFLEGSDAGVEHGLISGPPLSGAAVKEVVRALSTQALAGDIVSIESAPLLGHAYVILTHRTGERLRLDPGSGPAPLSLSEAEVEARALASGRSSPRLELLAREDEYYFSHHLEIVSLPVYRLILEDGTRYYLDPVSGALVSKVDRDAQGYRWLHEGLHRLDFSRGLRARPQWDVLMLVLLSGVTLVCATGAYMGLRSLLPRRRALRSRASNLQARQQPE
jgi:uncharacterized iron-regulated membrane protein